MKRFPIFAAAAAIVAAAALALLISPPAALRRVLPLAEPLPVYGTLADFQLVSDDGRPFAASSLDGRIWLASFLYTSCPGPCPVLVERLKSVRRAIPAGRMAIVSFSVDPQTDTPQVLASYKAARGIQDEDAWTFVTGPPKEVLDVVQRGFFTAVEKGDPASADGAVMHTVRVALVDGERQIRGFYATDSAEELSRLEKDVAMLD